MSTHFEVLSWKAQAEKGRRTVRMKGALCRHLSLGMAPLAAAVLQGFVMHILNFLLLKDGGSS